MQRFLLLAIAAAALSACGIKGPLVIPETGKTQDSTVSHIGKDSPMIKAGPEDAIVKDSQAPQESKGPEKRKP
ncbi:MAG: lipoprotein [Duodenibacillus sp.]|nr:lipoprotein [Duodenibacillus sp.]